MCPLLCPTQEAEDVQVPRHEHPQSSTTSLKPQALELCSTLQHHPPRSHQRFCPEGNTGVWGISSVARLPSRQRKGCWLVPWTNGARVPAGSVGWACSPRDRPLMPGLQRRWLSRIPEPQARASLPDSRLVFTAWKEQKEPLLSSGHILVTAHPHIAACHVSKQQHGMGRP